MVEFWRQKKQQNQEKLAALTLTYIEEILELKLKKSHGETKSSC